MKETVLIHGKKIAVGGEDVDGIMVSALEGGINYWCGEARVAGEYLGTYASEQISRGGLLYLEDFEDDETYVLNREKFMDGLRKFIRENATDYDCLLRQVDGSYTLDTCQIDAVAADMIIQYAVFGELVYS